jgi:hypothetical protein
VNKDRGAVAVEFALLLPILVLLLVSIMDFGLWYSDSIGLRSTAREGVRMAVVGTYPPDCSGSPAKKAACVAVSQATLLGGPAAAKVYSVDATTGLPGAEWKAGNELVVCTAIKETGLTGLGLVPQDGNLRSKVTMRIEVDQAGSSEYEDADPSAKGWTWC